jgi:hypothetical protein
MRQSIGQGPRPRTTEPDWDAMLAEDGGEVETWSDEEGNAAPPLVETAPAAQPAGTRETGRNRRQRIINLDQLNIVGEGRGRFDSVTPAEHEYTEVETREVAPLPPAPPPPAPAEPTMMQRLGRWGLDAAESVRSLPTAARPWLPGDPLIAGYRLPTVEQAGRGELLPRDAAPNGGRDVRSLSVPQGAANILTAGFGDELAAVPGANLHPFVALQNLVTGSNPARDSGEQMTARAREMQDLTREQDPRGVALGETLAMAPLMAAPTTATTALGRVALAGTQGGLMSGLRGAGEADEGDRVGAALSSGATGAALSAGLAGAGEVVPRALDRLGQWATRRGADAAENALAQRMQAYGLTQDPAPTTPLGRDLQAAGGRERFIDLLRTERVGGRFPTPQSTMEALPGFLQRAGQQMDDVTARMGEAASGRNAALLDLNEPAAMRGMVDVGRVGREFQVAANDLEGLPIGGPRAAQALRERVAQPLQDQGAMTFARAHQQRQMLDEIGPAWQRDPDLVTAGGQLQNARRSISTAMDEAAESVDPALREQWRAANRRYQAGAILRERARATSSNTPGAGAEAIGLDQVLSGQLGGAVPMMAGRAVGRELTRHGPAVRAVALEGLARRLQSMGPGAQRWARTLEGAQQRGQVAVAGSGRDRLGRNARRGWRGD